MRVLMLVARLAQASRPEQLTPSRESNSWSAAGVGVVPGDAEQFGGDAQMGEVAGDIARAAGNETFALKFHHRNGRLGGNAGDPAPEELVKHNVAQHGDAGAAGGGKQLADAGQWKVFAHGRCGKKAVQASLARKAVSGLVGLAAVCGAGRPIS